MSTRVKLWIFAALLMLGMVACSEVSATVHFRADDSYNYLTVNMTEQETQALFTGILEESRISISSILSSICVPVRSPLAEKSRVARTQLCR